MSWLPDAYTIQARLRPALLVALPGGLAVIAWFPEKFVGWGLLVGIATSFGLTALLAQLGRDQGKKKESQLFESWGGKPTTLMMRHRSRHFDSNTLQRYHQKLAALLPDLHLPSSEEEKADPEGADQVYESCARFLRERSRDKKKFPLVFDENSSYGFRRNLWGMKPVGIGLAIIGVLVCGVAIVWESFASIPAAAIGCLLVNLALLLWWLLWVKPDWVRLVADAYAERLLAVCEAIESEASE